MFCTHCGHNLTSVYPLQSGSMTRLDLIEALKHLGHFDDIDDHADRQTYELAYEVYQKLMDRLSLTDDEAEALNRLVTSIRSSGMSKAAHRNNIFKAANALGIKLPSSQF